MNMTIMEMVMDNRVLPTFKATMEVAMRYYNFARAEKNADKRFAYLKNALNISEVTFVLISDYFSHTHLTYSEWYDFFEEQLCEEYESH